MVVDYVPVGVPGVDEILAGKGIPKGHTILISGGPGSGKTTFATQFLYKILQKMLKNLMLKLIFDFTYVVDIKQLQNLRK